jgi:putative oxidoreductase
MFPQFALFTDLAVLLLRLMVGLVFVTSGYRLLKNPAARSKSIEMPKGFTVFLGIAEVAGGPGIAVMLGAIEKKIRSWHTGFWGEKAYGWHYDVIYILMNLVIVSTDGGLYVLLK